MKKLIAIGEALIDFIPNETNCKLEKVSSFYPKVGGAPLNVLGAYSKLGGKTEMITMLGSDTFGDKIVSEMDKYNIGKTYLKRTEKANTALAFVSLGENGSREFSFYRNPSADLLLSENDICPSCLSDAFAVHFCSVSLVDYPIKKAHEKLLTLADKNNVLISFDPNIRLPLWNDHKLLKKTVNDFIPRADILKIADDEIDFILNGRTLSDLFVGKVKLILLTKGENGAELYTKDGKTVISKPVKVNAVDTTGAGDCFIGSFLWKLSQYEVTPNNVEKVSDEVLQICLDFANKRASFSTTKLGAIDSYPEE